MHLTQYHDNYVNWKIDIKLEGIVRRISEVPRITADSIKLNSSKFYHELDEI